MKKVMWLVAIVICAVGAASIGFPHFPSEQRLLFVGVLAVVALIALGIVLPDGKGIQATWQLGEGARKAAVIIATTPAVGLVEQTDLLKNQPAASSVLNEKAKAKVRESKTRDELTVCLIANGLCPSLTHLNVDRYREVGKIDESMALRAVGLGLEIILRNYCRHENLGWSGAPPPPPVLALELTKVNSKLLSEEDANQFVSLFKIIEGVEQGSLFKQKETLEIVLDKTDRLIDTYIKWLLNTYSLHNDALKELKQLLDQ